MKKQAKLYKEYLDWIEKENQKGLKEYKKSYKKMMSEWKERQVKEEKEYQERLKKWEIEMARDDVKREVYKSLNPVIKFFTDYPNTNIFLSRMRPVNYSSLSMPPLMFYCPKVKESQEGFMKWLVENKYKL